MQKQKYMRIDELGEDRNSSRACLYHTKKKKTGGLFLGGFRLVRKIRVYFLNTGKSWKVWDSSVEQRKLVED